MPNKWRLSFKEFGKPFKKSKGKCCKGKPQDIAPIVLKPLTMIGTQLPKTIKKTFKVKK